MSPQVKFRAKQGPDDFHPPFDAISLPITNPRCGGRARKSPDEMTGSGRPLFFEFR
jgi:hypothetical protein